MTANTAGTGRTTTPRRPHDPYTSTLDEIETAAETLCLSLIRARRSRGRSRVLSLIKLHNLVRGMGLELNLALGGWPETAENRDRPISG